MGCCDVPQGQQLITKFNDHYRLHLDNKKNNNTRTHRRAHHITYTRLTMLTHAQTNTCTLSSEHKRTQRY